MTGKKILIVDDDKDLSLITGDMLEGYGYEVMSASDPDEAFILLEDTTVHLILLDINLPEMNGFEVCRELRRISKVPVIFASARLSGEAIFAEGTVGTDQCTYAPDIWGRGRRENLSLRRGNHRDRKTESDQKWGGSPSGLKGI